MTPTPCWTNRLDPVMIHIRRGVGIHYDGAA